MKSNLYVIIETPESFSREILKHASPEPEKDPADTFILPKDQVNSSNKHSYWTWTENSLLFEHDNKNEEIFLFLSPELSLADQMEGLIKLLSQKNDLQLARVLTFINSNFLKTEKKEFINWLDCCAHFSDVMCFTNRLNENAGKISEIMERYKNMCFPMETIILGLKKNPPIDQILAPISLRISHIFDHPDMLEDEDLPENDPYLTIKANKERVKTIVPFSKIFEEK
jgi:hypothetical protein